MLPIQSVPDVWETEEQLYLTSAVLQIGDQNWHSVSRTVRQLNNERNRPNDWYSTKNCASQYAKLLERVNTPKRKREKSEECVEAPGITLHKLLTKERVEELKKLLAEEKTMYMQLRNEIFSLETNQSDDKLNQYWDEMIAEQQKEEKEAERLKMFYQEREEKIKTQLAAKFNYKNAFYNKTSPSKDIQEITKTGVVTTGKTPEKLDIKDEPDLQFQEEVEQNYNEEEFKKEQSINKTNIETQHEKLEEKSDQTPSDNDDFKFTGFGNTPKHEKEILSIFNIRENRIERSNEIENKYIPNASILTEKSVEGKADEWMEENIPTNSDQIVQDTEHIYQKLLESTITPEKPTVTNDLKTLEKQEDAPVKDIKLKEIPKSVDEKVKSADILKIEESKRVLDIKTRKSVTLEPKNSTEQKFQDSDVNPNKKVNDDNSKKVTESSKKSSEDSKQFVDKEKGSENFQKKQFDNKKQAKRDDIKIKTKVHDAEGQETVTKQIGSHKKSSDSDKNTLNILKKLIDSDKKQPESSKKLETDKKQLEISKKLETNKKQLESSKKLESDKKQLESSKKLGTDRKQLESSKKLETDKKQLESSKKLESDKKQLESSKKLGTDKKQLESSKKLETDKKQLESSKKLETDKKQLESSKKLETDKKQLESSKKLETDKKQLEISKKLETNKKQLESQKKQLESPKKSLDVTPKNDDKKEPRDEYEFEDDASTESSDVREYMSRGDRRKFSLGDSLPVLSPSVSDCTPSSPASTYYGDDQESEKTHKQWKKSIMLIWNDISSHKNASLFLKPISEDKVPGYHSIVKRPMDLFTIKKSIDNGTIRSTSEFQRDVLLMFLNARMYNTVDNRIYDMAGEMAKDFIATIEEFIEVQSGKVSESTPKTLRRDRRESSSKRNADDFKRKRERSKDRDDKLKRRKLLS